MAENFKNVGTVIGGDGDPANGDGLCTNLSLFPVNSVYVNNSTGKVFTRDAANGVAADWVSQSGGSSLLQTATVTLTDAQIKNLPTEGIEVIAAPGVNKIVLPIFAYFVMNNVDAYTASGDASFVLSGGSQFPGEGKHMSSPCLSQSSLQAVGENIQSFIIPYSFPQSGGVLSGINVSYNPGATEGIKNQPVYIKDSDGGVSNYTGGNAANTLKVTVYYVVVDL